MWIPGALVYAGTGWSAGVLHTLEGDRRAVFCEPSDTLERHKNRTIELDHIIASVFGLWDVVIDEKYRLLPDPQMSLPTPGFTRVSGSVRSTKPKTDRRHRVAAQRYGSSLQGIRLRTRSGS